MIFRWLKRIFVTKDHALTNGELDPAAEGELYKGHHIYPRPSKNKGGWQVRGIIHFNRNDSSFQRDIIRADTCMTYEEAEKIALKKAKQIIDEQGENIGPGSAPL